MTRARLLVLAISMLMAVTGSAQTMRSFAIDCWSGGHCALPCGGSATGNYDCSDGTGGWTSGCAYTDPLPAGSVVTQIRAVLYTHQCNNAGTTLTVTMNGQTVGTTTEPRYSCQCTSSPCLDTVVTSANIPDGFPGYNAGGQNILGITVNSGLICIQNVELTLTYADATATITSAPPSITNGSDLVNHCVEYRVALEGEVERNGQPQRNVDLRFTSNRNTGGVTPDSIRQIHTTTATDGHVSGEMITRKQGAVQVGATVDPQYRVIPANFSLQRAYYENRFQITAYYVVDESEFAGGAQVTNPCGLTGTFYQAFLTSNRGVLMEGTGRSLNGDLITIDWNATPRPNRNNVCFTTDTCARTASGACAQANVTIAVDPAKIPMGANVEIENRGNRIAQDTGDRIRGYHIDNFAGFGRAAMAGWGNFHAVVTYLGGGPNPCN